MRSFVAGKAREAAKNIAWDWVAVAAGALIVGLVGWSLIYPTLSTHLPDNRLILYRYAEQFRAGNGLVFNPGDRTLLIFAPLYMLALAILGPELLFALALALGAASLFRLAIRLELTPPTALLAAGIYALAWPLWSGAGTAFPLMSGLALLALDLALRERWRMAGVALAAAALCSPEALIIAFVVGVRALQKGQGTTYGVGLFVPLAVTLALLVAFYGPGFFDGLLVTGGSAVSLLDTLSLPFLAVLVGLAAYVWWQARGDEHAALLGAWIGLYAAVLLLLRVFVGWQYAPIIGPAALLAGTLFNRYPILSLLVVFLIVMTTLIAGDALFRDQSAPAAMRIAVPRDVSSIGVYSKATALEVDAHANQQVIALDGRLQPQIKQMLERGDTQSLLIRYAPEMLIVRSVDEDLFAGSILSRLGYVPLSRGNTFRRDVETGDFQSFDSLSVTRFGTDIQLLGGAADRATFQAGDQVRVRLDWDFARPATRPVTVELRLLAGAQVLAETRDEFASSVFRAGGWSTYHVLRLPAEPFPGPVSIEAGVIINGGLIGRVPLASLSQGEQAGR